MVFFSILSAQPAYAAASVNVQEIYLSDGWPYADSSVIHTGAAMLYTPQDVSRKGIVVGVNAGHGTAGGESAMTYCHPDRTAKVTGGTTSEGSIQAISVSSGMTFFDGTPESSVNLRVAQFLRDKLLAKGYDVLMIRDGEDVQLDNVARTVICNNNADCHIAIHFDGDGLGYDKGCYYCSVPEGIKYMEPVSYTWEEDERLGQSLINGLSSNGLPIWEGGSMDVDLTQTSYSSVASVDIELGNAASDHSDAHLEALAEGLSLGVDEFFGSWEPSAQEVEQYGPPTIQSSQDSGSIWK